ncbi:MAG: GNAT family N-acetyltransferase [Actinomycetota bacterium]|nr:GNAT family N-acetyltransferase [Actinomycetota bacterium]
MAIKLRPIEEEEFDHFLETAEVAFSDEIRPEHMDRFKRVLPAERTLAAFDGDTMVASAGAFDFTLTVPGARVPAAGVTVVGVIPTHRRRGILRSMMKRQLEDTRAANEALAVLWASESPIYTKFGYGLASEVASIDVQRHRAGMRFEPDHPGTTRLVSQEEALDVLPRVYDRVCESTPGMFARTRDWWEAHRLPDPEYRRQGAGPMFRVIVEIDGEPEGYGLYRARSSWDDDGVNVATLEVIEALATGHAAEHTLWSYLFNVDLISRVKAHFVPVDLPLKLFMSDRRHLRMRVHDGLWLRIVDVERALEARSYAADGRLVFELIDAFCPWNAGVWELETTNGASKVRRSDATPDMSLTTEELAAVYLGGTTFAQLLRANRVQELAPGAVEVADDLFRTSKAPWCPEIF